MKVGDCELIEAISCDVSDGVIDVARKLRDAKKRHLIVTDSGKPVGIISSVDIVNRFVAEEGDYSSVKAFDIMTSPIVVKDVDDLLSGVYVDMVKNGVLSCPVVERGELKGNLDLHQVMRRLAKGGEKN